MSANHSNRLWAQSPLEEIVVHTLGGDWGKDVENVIANYELARVVRGTDFKTWSEEKGAGAAKRKIKKTSIEKRRLAAGDLVVEISGGGPTQPVGRTVLIDEAALADCSLPLICSNFFRQVRLNKEVEARFVNFFLQYSHQQGAFNDLQTETTNLRNLNFNRFLAETIIPLPPLDEQRRIVAKLEELFKRADACRKRLDQIPRLLKQFRQSVLNSAISGRLTADWREQNPEIEPAKIILKAIAPGAALLLAGGLPSTWVRCKLSDLSELITKGASPKWQGVSYSDEGVLFVTSENVGWGEMLLSEKKYVEFQFNTIQKRSILKRGDLLTNIVGASIGRSAVFESDEVANINQAVAVIRLYEPINSQYIKAVLNSPALVSHMHGEKVDVARANLSLKDVGDFPISLPPLAEQNEIACRVKALFKVADAVEDHYRKAHEQLDKLPQSILAKAFRGELVPQDPNDEPASAVLDRIREDRLTELRMISGNAPRRRSTAR